MDEEIKVRWLEKLRSGLIPQLEGFLGDTKGARCCLGVLCDIAVEDGIIPFPTVDVEDGILRYGDANDCNTSLLPKSVEHWACLTSGDEFSPTSEDFIAWGDDGYCSSHGRYLTQLNDAGVTFNTIADTIERHF